MLLVGVAALASYCRPAGRRRVEPLTRCAGLTNDVRYSKGLVIVLMVVVGAPQRAAPTLAITSIAVVDAAQVPAT